MILTWTNVRQSATMPITQTLGEAPTHTIVHPVATPMDDPYQDWKPCKPCGVILCPQDQVRVVGYQAVLCLSCAIDRLNLESLGPDVRVEVSFKLRRRLRDAAASDNESVPSWRPDAR